MIEGKTRQETMQLTAQALSISELEAEFLIALEKGDITSDVEVIQAQSTPKSSFLEGADIKTPVLVSR